MKKNLRYIVGGIAGIALLSRAYAGDRKLTIEGPKEEILREVNIDGKGIKVMELKEKTTEYAPAEVTVSTTPPKEPTKPEKVIEPKPKKEKIYGGYDIGRNLEGGLGLGVGYGHGDGMNLAGIDLSYMPLNLSLIYGEKSKNMPIDVTTAEGTKYIATGTKKESIDERVLGAYISMTVNVGKGIYGEFGGGINRRTTTIDTTIKEEIKSKNGNVLSRNTESYSRKEQKDELMYCLGIGKRIKDFEFRAKSYVGKGKPYYVIGITYRPKH